MTAMEKKDKNLNVPNLRFPEFSGEWESTPISTIADIIGGGTPDTSVDEYWGGNIQWFTPSEIGKEKYAYLSDRTITEAGLINSSAKLLPQGTVLLSTRATIGECSIATAECTTNQGFQSLVAKKNNVSSEFLYYIVAKIKREMLRRSCGSTFLEISANELKKIHANIPSKAEQEKLVSLLSLIDQRIETQKKIIEKCESLIRGLYHSVFNNPSSILQLREVVSIIKGKQVNGEELLEEGKYYVMNGGTEPSGYLDEYNTPANTISISEGGNSCGYVQYNTEPFWSGGHCYSLHQKDEGVKYSYLYHFLKYKERDIMALRIGSGLPNVQKKDLERFEVRVLPIEQQDRVAEILEDISAKCDLEKKILQEWQWQKSFLLSNLFI